MCCSSDPLTLPPGSPRLNRAARSLSRRRIAGATPSRGGSFRRAMDPGGSQAATIPAGLIPGLDHCGQGHANSVDLRLGR